MSHEGCFCDFPNLEQSAHPKQGYGWVTFYMEITHEH